MTDSEILDKVFSDYEKSRTTARNNRDHRVEKIEKEYPELAEIDMQITKLGLENMKNVIDDPKKSDEYNENFKNQLKKLNKKKQKILNENEIPADYNEIKYNCKKCNDTGYTSDGKKCSCFIQKVINEEYKNSNIEELLEKENFQTFSFKYYSDKKDKNGLSPLENMHCIYKIARSFCENFNKEKKGLIFTGKPGLGKTFLSSCIAKELIDNGKSVIYITAECLFETYSDYKFGKNTDESSIRKMRNCDLLIIDDFGAQMTNSMGEAFLQDMLNERLLYERKVIINTNLTIKEIAKLYGNRLGSRIYEYFIVSTFIGDDIRIKKFKEE